MKQAPRPGPVLVVVALLALLLAVVLSNGGSSVRTARGATPQEQINNLLYDGLVAAMREGNPRRYVACFGEPLRAELEAAVRQQGRAAFSAQLKSLSAAVTGVAVSRVEVLENEASARIEWVHRSESDVQVLRLKRNAGRWQIVGMEGVQRAKLPIPYGTEVIPGLKDDPTKAPATTAPTAPTQP